MERQIKFRAYNKKLKEGKVFFPDLEMNDGIIVNCENLKFMQFTGLKDKNGKEIYEGDIVRIGLEINGKKIYENVEVRFNENLLNFDGVRKEDTIQLTLFNYPDIERIGNIYENPDLLNGGSS